MKESCCVILTCFVFLKKLNRREESEPIFFKLSPSQFDSDEDKMLFGFQIFVFIHSWLLWKKGLYKYHRNAAIFRHKSITHWEGIQPVIWQRNDEKSAKYYLVMAHEL